MKTAAALLAFATGASAFTSTSQPASRATVLRAADDEAYTIDFRAKQFKFDPVRRRHPF